MARFALNRYRDGDIMSKKQAIFAAFAILSCGSPALAADLWQPQPSVKDEGVYEQRSRWDGFYLGLNGGYAFADTNNAPFYDAGTPVASLGDLGAEGGFGGGQIGYNYVTGRLLLGVEADVQAADIGDSTGSAFGAASTQIDAFGTVRGRIGFVSDRTLIYATGGYAWADVESRFTAPARSVFRRATSSTVMSSAAVWSTRSPTIGVPSSNTSTSILKTGAWASVT